MPVVAPARPLVGLATLTALTAAAVLALTGCTSADLGTTPVATPLPTTGWHGTPLTEPFPKPAVTLTDLAGRPFRFDRDARRAVVLVTFGYTHCPWVCAEVLRDLAAALRPLDPGTRSRVMVLFVTVDPARDDAAALRSYLARFDETFVGLRAPLAVVRRLGEDLGVAVTGPQSATPRPSGTAGTGSTPGYTVGHGAQVVGFGPDGQAHLIWMPGTTPGDLRADVVRLASWS